METHVEYCNRLRKNWRAASLAFIGSGVILAVVGLVSQRSGEDPAFNVQHWSQGAQQLWFVMMSICLIGTALSSVQAYTNRDDNGLRPLTFVEALQFVTALMIVALAVIFLS